VRFFWALRYRFVTGLLPEPPDAGTVTAAIAGGSAGAAPPRSRTTQTFSATVSKKYPDPPSLTSLSIPGPSSTRIPPSTVTPRSKNGDGQGDAVGPARTTSRAVAVWPSSESSPPSPTP